MNRRKTLLNIGNGESVIPGYFQEYEEYRGLTICTGAGNRVISVENNTKDQLASIFYDDELLTGLPPGSTMSFGTLRLNREELTFSFKDASKLLNYEDDTDYQDCND